MLMLKFYCDILNPPQYEGSRFSCVFFFITCSSIQTAEIPYETFYVTYAHIQPYIYGYMKFGCTHKLSPI